MIITVLGGVVDDRREQQTNGDRPLVTRYNGTTDPLWRTLGLVHGDEDGDETDTETGEDTADDEGSPLVAASLESDTEGEGECGEEDTTATTEPVSDVCTEESTWQRGKGGGRGESMSA